MNLRKLKPGTMLRFPNEPYTYLYLGIQDLQDRHLVFYFVAPYQNPAIIVCNIQNLVHIIKEFKLKFYYDLEII